MAIPLVSDNALSPPTFSLNTLAQPPSSPRWHSFQIHLRGFFSSITAQVAAAVIPPSATTSKTSSGVLIGVILANYRSPRRSDFYFKAQIIQMTVQKMQVVVQISRIRTDLRPNSKRPDPPTEDDGPGLAITPGCWARHDQLTNATPAASLVRRIAISI
jgi:hypothetical protein